jgi:hypothetical protein
MPGGSPAAQLAFAASIVALVVYVGGFATSMFLPEPSKEALQE